MTPYTMQRIREALTASKGNRRKTEDMVRAMALDDPKLFADLMAPHLVGVIAHSVARIADGKEANDLGRPEKPVPVAFAQDAFGRDLVKAIKNNDVGAFGMPQPKTLAAGPKPASKQHIDAIKAIASKTIKKDKKVIHMAMFARHLLDERIDMRADFLNLTDWRGGQVVPLNADMGTRRYLRVTKGDRSAVLLESLPDGHPDASPGHRMDDWIQVNKLLASNGLSVPQIYAQDLPAGLMLLEDWGDRTFTSALDTGHDQVALYKLGTQAAKALNQIQIPTHFPVPNFFASHLPKTARRLIDWFAPLVRQQKNEDGLAEAFEAVLDQIYQNLLQTVGQPTLCFTHTDFHPGNLMLLDRPGIKACGILDFQNPMHAPVPYDFINLLFDARRTPSPEIVNICRDLYCDDMTTDELQAFNLWGVYTAMLFHARVTGQFLKAGLMGHGFYMQFLPVVAGHLATDLRHPVLKPLADFLAAHKISLSVPEAIDLEKVRGLIRSDAV